MPSNQLIRQLRYEEGVRLKVYRCSEGKRTIGIGRNLDANPEFEGNIIPDEITEDVAEAILLHDILQAEKHVAAAWHGFELLTGPRRDAVIQMVFQLGLDGFLGFKKLRQHLLKCEWVQAKAAALDSKWARQTPERAKRVANQFLTGEYYIAPAVGVLR